MGALHLIMTMRQQANAILIEVSVENVAPAGFIAASGHQSQAATLRGRSSVSELCFSETVYVVDESLRKIRILQSHGSVVVTVSERWRYEYDAEGGWRQHVLNEAVRIVTLLPKQDDEGVDVALGFDQALANQILEVLDKIYPSALKSPMELKDALGRGAPPEADRTRSDA